MLAGEFTVEDEKLYRFMGALKETEDIFIEPSSCAAFYGTGKNLFQQRGKTVF